MEAKLNGVLGKNGANDMEGKLCPKGSLNDLRTLLH